MFKKEKRALRELKKQLAGAIGDELIAITAFGSRVRGDFMGNSDFDILIVVKRPSMKIEKAIREIVYSEGERFDIPYSAIIMGREEFDMEKELNTPFYRAVMKEGLVLYERRPEQRRQDSVI